MKKITNYISGIFKGVWSLLLGMTVTGSYFFRPWKIVTQQYPENRKKLKMFDRFKGEVIMLHNEKNEHRCNGCGICMMNCPNGTIEVITTQIITEDGKKKRILEKHIYRHGMCSFCGLCVKSCPSKALAFAPTFEHAVFNKNKLIMQLNHEGSVLTKEVKE